MGGRTSLGALPNTRCSLSPDNRERSRSTSPGSERVAQGPRLWAGFLPLDGGQAGSRMSSHLWRNVRGLRGCSFPLCCYPGSALQEMLCFRHQQQSCIPSRVFCFLFSLWGVCRVPRMAGRQDLASVPVLGGSSSKMEGPARQVPHLQLSLQSPACSCKFPGQDFALRVRAVN